MTGWRIGWTLSPLNVAKAMDSLQSQETSNPSSVSQYAALAAVSARKSASATCSRNSRSAASSARPAREVAERHVSRNGGRVLRVLITSKRTWAASTAACSEQQRRLVPATLAQQGVATVMGPPSALRATPDCRFATSLDVLEKGFDGIEAFLKS